MGTGCDDCDNDDIPDGCAAPTSCDIITVTDDLDPDLFNVTITPDPGVIAAGGVVTVTVAEPATLNNVRVFGGAQLLVTGGDLTATEGILIDVRSTAIAGGLGSSLLVGAGNSLTAARLEGKRGGVIEVEGDAATTINEAFTLDRGGIYRKKVGAVD